MIKKDNRGFSLVELVICMAIMAIVLGMLVGSLNYIGNSQARALANAVKTSVGQCRIQTMGKYESYLYIYRGADKKYYKEVWRKSKADDWVHENVEVIGKQKPVVKYKIKGDTSEYTLDVGTPGFMVTFDRSNGKEISTSANVLPAGTQDADSNVIDSVKPVKVSEITVSYGGTEYKITIVPETGKISL
ncbi:MAG: prepilin-type N-terminal cleavage/methylation domain-containing protein [Lachnospiraceae bacterium]|nr:prepilin-type N-terminal cleavage/methylation domain-containing protein [Lachnospiraceae bacterium]